MRSIPLNFNRPLTTPFKVRRCTPANGIRPGTANARLGGPLAVCGDDRPDLQPMVRRLDRMEALLERIKTRETILRVGTLELDLIDRTARRIERTIELLPREYTLLKYMMQHSGQLLARSTLLADVWHYKCTPATNRVDVHMSRLRHKVDRPNEVPMIHNVRGAGFILCAEF
jgi:two-component system OmpR family response regulator